MISAKASANPIVFMLNINYNFPIILKALTSHISDGTDIDILDAPIHLYISEKTGGTANVRHSHQKRPDR